jgi:formylglycine-generating enzyme required for sulfatase activity
LDLPNTSERVPLNCVSWFEAAAFCAWDEGRLPTFAESMYAAAGGELDRTYPWGNEPTPTRVYALHGCALGQERAECTASYVLPVGSHPLGAGLYQHHDLAGSMTEWMLDGSPYVFTEGCTDCAGLIDAGATEEPRRYWRGGSWLDPAASLVNSNYQIVDPTFRLHFLGLRCAR